MFKANVESLFGDIEIQGICAGTHIHDGRLLGYKS